MITYIVAFERHGRTFYLANDAGDATTAKDHAFVFTADDDAIGAYQAAARWRPLGYVDAHAEDLKIVTGASV